MTEPAWTTRARIARQALTAVTEAPEVAGPETSEATTAETPAATTEIPAATTAETPAAVVEPEPRPDVDLDLDLELDQAAVLAGGPVGARRRAAARGELESGGASPGAAAGRAPPWRPPARIAIRMSDALPVGVGAGAPVRPVEAHARGPPFARAHEAMTTGGPLIQAKLAVSAPGDAFEREADVVADRVLRGTTPHPLATGLITGRLVRAPPHARGPPAPGSFPGSVRTALASGGGHPLDPALRARIEPHVGVDLTPVRVRREAAAATAARDLGARAFTSGATIYLAAGSSPADVGLMAHEAAHVAQQAASAAAAATLQRLDVTDVIPDWILDGVSSAVRAIPGYTILSTIVGQDLLTGAPATVSREELVETLLTYGPFGAAVGPVLSAVDVLGDVFDVIEEGLQANDLTLARIGRDIETAWDEFSIFNAIAGNVAIVRRLIERLLADVRRFVGGIVDRVIEIVRSVVADVAEPLLQAEPIRPVWELTKKVLHLDPLRGQPVAAETTEIIADFLRLIGQEQRLAQMQERGTLQQTADWLDTQLVAFASLVDELGTLFSDAWAAIQPQNLPDLPTNLESLAQRAFGFIGRVAEFGTTLIAEVLRLIKDSLLAWLSEHAHGIPGFELLTVILEQDPFTGAPVERTARNLIRGFITLMPGGAETFDQLAESGVIDQAAERIESAMARLGISVELITGIFTGLWDTLTLDDLLDPIGAFERVLALFGEPLSRLVEFVVVVLEVVVTLVLRLLGFPSELLGRVIDNAVQAIDLIAADPVGFLLNMLEAVKLGLSSFFDNVLTHLTQGLAAWLFRGLGRLGIQLPVDFSVGSILSLVLQVLGLTVEHLWEKLGAHVGPERVAMMRGAIDHLTGAWAFIGEVQRDGLAAIWRFVADQLGGLWDTLLSMASEWIMTRVVSAVTTKLLSMLDPTGIMAVVNSFIAFFHAVQSAIEYFRDILEIVAGYVETLGAIAAGNVAPGAQMLEQGLADAIPIAIGFLAAQVGLGNIPEKVVEIIGRLRELVDRALDWLIAGALRLGRAALDVLRGEGEARGPQQTPAAPPDPEKQARIDAGLAQIDSEQAARLEAGELSREDAEAVAAKVKLEHPVFTSLTVVDGDTRWDYDYTASPGQIKTGAPKDEKTAREAHDEVMGRMSADNLSVLKGHGDWTAGHAGTGFTTATRDAVDDIGYAAGDHSDSSIKEPGTRARPETKWGKLGKGSWIPDHQPFNTIGGGGASVTFRFYPHSNTSRYKQGGAVRVYKAWMMQTRSRGESNWSEGVQSDWFW